MIISFNWKSLVREYLYVFLELLEVQLPLGEIVHDGFLEVEVELYVIEADGFYLLYHLSCVGVSA